jgi:hypothetical protein
MEFFLSAQSSSKSTFIDILLKSEPLQWRLDLADYFPKNPGSDRMLDIPSNKNGYGCFVGIK